VRTLGNLSFEVFEGFFEFPDVDAILTYHPKALPNQRGLMLAIAKQERGERALWSSRYKTTHAFWKHVQERPGAIGVIDLLSETVTHEILVAFMFGLVIRLTFYEAILDQLFQVFLAHTGERIRERIPGDRDTRRVTM
jgi:hypothetical protein